MPKVTVYVQPPGIPCSQCTITKRVLDTEEIPYHSIDITPELATQFKERNLMSAPVVEAEWDDGHVEVWAGFQPHRIKGLKEKRS